MGVLKAGQTVPLLAGLAGGGKRLGADRKPGCGPCPVPQRPHQAGEGPQRFQRPGLPGAV
eukprot:8322855-Lingulodinium_polyedra.AAC.1